MSDYESLLKETLRGVNEGFEEARIDLNAAIARLARAVKAASEDSATVVLEPSYDDADNNESGMCYYLHFQSIPDRDENRRELCSFWISPNGYPVKLRGTPDRDGVRNVEQELRNSSAFDPVLRKMVSEKNSPLLAMIAYVLRNRMEASPV